MVDIYYYDIRLCPYLPIVTITAYSPNSSMATIFKTHEQSSTTTVVKNSTHLSVVTGRCTNQDENTRAVDATEPEGLEVVVQCCGELR